MVQIGERLLPPPSGLCPGLLPGHRTAAPPQPLGVRWHPEMVWPVEPSVEPSPAGCLRPASRSFLETRVAIPAEARLTLRQKSSSVVEPQLPALRDDLTAKPWLRLLDRLV